ncbi:furin-like protease 2 [Daphnia magna]|uniref:furin n=3 Tax=Daphnia magna TaxID=35525 RepID=A0A0N8D9Y9_9CRUS|nr:furin-like protease 2 [Daphnia magna]KZS13967.1 Furin Protease 2 [Daphnia magna]
MSSRLSYQRTCDTTVMSVIKKTILLVIVYFSYCCASSIVEESNDLMYNNQFAVNIPNASEVLVQLIAEKHGFRSLGQVGSLDGYFLFEHDHVHKRSADPSGLHHEKLVNEPGVVWVAQQFEKKRYKRDFASRAGISNFALGKGSEFPDPFYREQWYLHGGSQEGFDMNVIPAWRKGYSGKGIVVSILDDGIQTNHPDLAQNYDPLASSDINDNDSDPMPRDNGDNKHGTRCAGEVAAVAFNSYCGVGIAFNASIGGVRMLDGTVNDAVEARALSLNPDHIDIYSASWGPEDDGKTVDGPGPLAKRAFINGIMKGRKGRGSIFVWASGNGGRHDDSCNCDGYTNSIFTLSISSATQGGFKPWYLEECSSTLATTYSSGRPDVDRSIATVDMDGSLRPEFLCTSDHTGTSASAPLAAGICALALEANSNLTWRDMQHLVVFTSRPDPLHDNGWVTNGIGKKVSHKFGYGLMDASAMVTLAEQWTNVPPQHVCQTPADQSDRLIPSGFGQKLEVVVETDACAGSAHEIRFLEHVQCRISLRFAPRGNLRIRLTSPSGTQSVLLFERPRDVLDSSFDDWPFMSVHFWGERASGRWKLEILNAGVKRVNKAGILKKWQLVFYGTDTNPIRLRSLQTPRPTFPNLGGGAATIGRDVHRLTAPPSVATPFAPTFKSVGHVPNPTGGQLFFPGNPGFRPSNFPNTGYPDFLQFAGSQPVTYSAALEATQPSNVGIKNNCPNFSLDGNCVDACPPTGYYVSPEMVCLNCHSSCRNCTGAEPHQCLSCAPQFSQIIDKNLCVEHCPDGYHMDETKMMCIPCQPQCNTCNSALECSSCEFRFVIHDGQCLPSCLPGYYETDDYACAPCDTSCSTCRGPHQDHCVTCADSFSEFNGSCIQRCPEGFWSHGLSGSKQCLPCPPGCEACSLKENGFDLVCSRCADQWVLDVSTLLCLNPSANICPEGEYVVEGKCYPCHGSCSECSGSSSSQCTHCSNRTMHLGSCLESCPQGTFVEAGSVDSRHIEFCRPCPHACAQCDSMDHCTECLGALHLQNGRCLASCEDGYYSDRGVCVRCHGSCASCSGPLATDCTRCANSFSWLQHHCLSQCHLGHYNISLGSLIATEFQTPSKMNQFLCARCHASCQMCEVSPLNCLSCSDGFVWNNSTCIPASVEARIFEIPLVEFVKESEGRGIRAKDNVEPGHFISASHWLFGVAASFIAGLIVVLAIQVKSRSKKYSRVPLSSSENDHETGHEKLLFASDEDESDNTYPKV